MKKCKSCIINHICQLKCLIFLCFGVELCNTLEKDEQEIIISTLMKKFYFWVKYSVFIKNENEFLENSDFWYTASNNPTQQVFQIRTYINAHTLTHQILHDVILPTHSGHCTRYIARFWDRKNTALN